MNDNFPSYELRPIGRVDSQLVDLANAPAQGDEGGPDAWVVVRPELQQAMRTIAIGDRIIVLTWLDRADREVLVVHPRGDLARPEAGVFSTRSSDRPNPIGLHEVRVLAVDGTRLKVGGLEAIDGTPVLDIKPVLGPPGER
jgi:tRNA-Thr(GGU) m(6)t(6)A37 methyltransferase TsaA